MTKCVKVDGNPELIKEAADLFFKLGYKPYPKTGVDFWINQKAKYLVIDFCETFIDWSGSVEGSEVTLQELRAMVTPNQKEYLVKTDTGYVLQVLSDVVDGHDGIIEVPEGAMSYWECNKYIVKFFSKIEKGSHFYHYLNKNSKWVEWGGADFKTFEMKWQRESLNDQVASAEKARQEQIQCKCSTKELHESDLVNDGQKVVDSLVVGLAKQNSQESKVLIPSIHGKVRSNPDLYGLKSTGFSEGGFIPKQNHGAPVGLEHHKFIQPEELPFVGLDTKFATEYQAEFFRKDDELDGDLCVEYVENAWNKQIGGDHYKKLAIQPMEYALQNKLDYAQANVVKYVTRHADKNGKADLLKAKHCIDLMIAHYYSDQE